jgi:surface protein
MTLGKVKIDQLEYERVDVESKDEDAEVRKFRDDKPMYPAVIDKEKFNWTAGDSYVDWEQIGKEDYTSSIWNPEQINNEVDKMVFVKNKGTYDAYVRTVFAFEAGQYENLDEFLKAVHMNRNETDWSWDWNTTPVAIPNKDGTVTTNYFIATATYNKAVQPGELTEISLAQLALDPAATNEDLKAFGDTYQVLVKSQAIQADGFENELLSTQELIKSALDEGFGAVENNLPFEHDDPYRGTDLRTALHNYMGDTTKVITNKITNVVFGLEEKYPQITQNYTGTLVDVGQDIPAYAYYVEEGETYTVYFLSEGTIYAPEDSNKLFSGMAALTAVDTTNLDVSRVKIMDRMFYNSRKLKQVDVSNWDTSNVTSMNGTFFYCQSIDGLDVSNWDVSKVTTMYAMFYDCKELSALDVSNWDVGSVTIMEFTFGGCKKIEYLDVSNWDVSKVTSFDSFLSSSSSNVGNMSLKSIDVSKWNTSNVVDMFGMFYGCGSLTKLDLRGLDVENVTNMSHMFCDCYGLTEIDYTGWNTASIQTVDAMFNNCNSMTVIDVTEFDTETLEETCQMFEACYSLERIVGL